MSSNCQPSKISQIRAILYKFGGFYGGGRIRIYDVANALTDLFNYGNKIGLDVTLEVVREGWRLRHFTMVGTERYAWICRAQRVIAPYLEAPAI